MTEEGDALDDRMFLVVDPPFIVEGMILLNRIAGRGIQSEGDAIIQRWVLDFLMDVDVIGFENAAKKWAGDLYDGSPR